MTQCYKLGAWERTWEDEEYAAAVEAVRGAIARGDVYQVNLVQHLAADFEGDPAALAPALLGLSPLQGRPFSGEDWAIVSASPERFLRRPHDNGQLDRNRDDPIGAERRLGGFPRGFARLPYHHPRAVPEPDSTFSI